MSYSFSDWQVTPKRKMSELKLPLSLEQKIDIFFERTDGWQLGIADKIINGVIIDKSGKFIGSSESAYAVLNIVFSFFETIAKYQDGYVGKESKRYFKKGVISVFPEICNHPAEFLDMLYGYARCGLYHGGFPNTRVFVRTDIPKPLGFTKKLVYINPQRLILDLRDYLKSYVEKLRDARNTEARKNFEKRFDSLNKLI